MLKNIKNQISPRYLTWRKTTQKLTISGESWLAGTYAHSGTDGDADSIVQTGRGRAHFSQINRLG